MAATQVMSPAANSKAKNGDAAGKKRAIEDIEEEIKAFEARFEAMQQQRIGWEMRLRNGDPPAPDHSAMEVKGGQIVGRWRKWGGEWTPRPIGIL